MAEKLGAGAAAAMPARCRAGAVRALRRADRASCHQAITWKGFEQAEHPCARTPSGRSRRTQSSGSAARRATAARAGPSTRPRRTAKWRTGKSRSSAPRWAGVLARNEQERAHPDELQHVPPVRPRDAGAEAINLAKRLVQEKGCRACRGQRPWRNHRARPDARRREGARAMRLLAAVGPADAFAWHGRTSRTRARSSSTR